MEKDTKAKNVKTTLELSEEEYNKLRGYSKEEAHALAETLKAEGSEIEPPKVVSIKDLDLDLDLDIDWDNYPVEDDLPGLDDEVYNNLPFEEQVFIDELSAYLDELVRRINPEASLEIGISISAREKQPIEEEEHNDGYHFVKETVVEPQEVLEKEDWQILFEPPKQYLDYIAKKRQIERICQCLVCMGYISGYDLERFHKGEIWISFDPIQQTHGSRQMAIDCIVNGIHGALEGP